MKKDLSLSALASNAPIINDYDPNAMSVEKAKTWITHFLYNIDQKESIHIKDALHRVLANPVIATMNVPNHDNSAMDGYALNTQDLATAPSRLRLSQTIAAGHPGQPLVRGRVARIFTGAPLPFGADAVVMQENTQIEDNIIVINDLSKN